uniref:Uncharacterized protein n=1 Tax=Arundo donax TaxID=35708 RepID=A0A0A9FDD8_ARUDO
MTRPLTTSCRGAPPTTASWSGIRTPSRPFCCPGTSSTTTSPASSGSSTPMVSGRWILIVGNLPMKGFYEGRGTS